MKTGAPPTARHARTGEFTAPGIRLRARSNRAFEFFLDNVIWCRLRGSKIGARYRNGDDLSKRGDDQAAGRRRRRESGSWLLEPRCVQKGIPLERNMFSIFFSPENFS